MGKIDEAKKLLEQGIPQSEMEKMGYNKGTITKAKNKLMKDRKVEEQDKKKDLNEKKKENIELLIRIKEVLEKMNEGYEYTVVVKKEKINKPINNVYEVFQEYGKELYVEKIKFLDKQELVTLGIEVGCENLKNKDKVEIIETICKKIENTLSIGKSFRE